MKYGIKHDNGTIKAISQFSNDFVLAGFIEITKAKYDKFILDTAANPFATYDSVKNEITLDEIALANEESRLEKYEIRNRLEKLSIELDLMQRLAEDTTDKQAEFDALKLQYEAL